MCKIVLFNITPHIPYGLMYIASYIRQYGIPVKITDNFQEVLNSKAEIVGINAMFTEDDKKIHYWASYAKKSLNCRVVIGGNYASANASEFAKYDYIGHIVVGEGEQSFYEICCGLKDKIVQRPMLDIDKIPMPAYDLVDMEGYLSKPGNPFSMRKRTLPIISSRGCPNNCIYCSIGAVWGRTWRGRNPKLVVDEIEYLQKTYNVHEFSFFDDSMSIDRKRLEEICLELIRRKLKIKWTTPNGIAHWTLQDSTLTLMQKAGCYRVTFGIESGNKSIRRFIGKSYPLEEAKKLLQYANKIGLWTITTNIIGLPNETEKEVKDTVDFALDCDTDFACFYKLTPHKGTELYNHLDKIQFTDKKLTIIQRRAYRIFLISRILTAPFRLARKVKSWEDFWYMVKLCWLGLTVLMNTFKKKENIIYG